MITVGKVCMNIDVQLVPYCIVHHLGVGAFTSKAYKLIFWRPGIIIKSTYPLKHIKMDNFIIMNKGKTAGNHGQLSFIINCIVHSLLCPYHFLIFVINLYFMLS